MSASSSLRNTLWPTPNLMGAAIFSSRFSWLFCRHIAVEKLARQTGLAMRKPSQRPHLSEQDGTGAPQLGHFAVRIGPLDGMIVAEPARSARLRTSNRADGCLLTKRTSASDGSSVTSPRGSIDLWRDPSAYR